MELWFTIDLIVLVIFPVFGIQDVCVKNPCFGDATCEPFPGGLSRICICTNSILVYTEGKGCIRSDPCIDNPCKGAKCITKYNDNSYRCECPQSHQVYRQGEGCLNLCQLKPCIGDLTICSLEENKRTCICLGSNEIYDEVKGCIVKPCSGTCTSHGDPHYISFDGLRFDFQGPCKYLLASYPGNEDGSCKFEIRAKNKKLPNNPRVSYTEYVELLLDGKTIKLTNNGRISVDDLPKAHPVNSLTEYNVRTLSRKTVYITSSKCGFTINFKSQYTAQIQFHGDNQYWGKLSGLCGNCNGIASDDKHVCAAGDVVGHLFIRNDRNKYPIGDSCMVPDKDAVLQECSKPLPPVQCSKDIYKGNDKCGLIGDDTGAFSNCIKHAVIGKQTLLESCVFDACVSNGDMKYVCDSLEHLESMCKSRGFEVKPWRKTNLCPAKCPPNSHFVNDLSPCQPTCTDQRGSSSCPYHNEAGCKCNSGFVLAGTECIPLTHCKLCTPNPCKNSGECAIVNGHVKCICREGFVGDICGDRPNECLTYPCKAGSTCQPLDEGGYRCLCRPGELYDAQKGCHGGTCSRTCTAHGDPHYISFDGLRFDFQGPCKYLLASYPGNEDGSCKFKIVAKNKRLPKHPLVSYTEYVELHLDGKIIKLSNNGRIWVDDLQKAHPVNSLTEYNVRTLSRKTVYITSAKCGFTINFKTEYNVQINFHGDNQYRGKLSGLCGNCNGIASDDKHVCAAGDVVGHLFIRNDRNKYPIGDSCMVHDKDAVLQECSKPLPPIECSKDIFKGNDKCGFINDVTGPFSNCIKHESIDRQTHFENCVFDACVSNGDMKYVCASLENLESICKSNGLEVKPWRHTSLCPAKCPPNSHFVNDLSPCQPTCTDQRPSALCPHHNEAGCKCNSGFVLAGTECIPLKDCDLCTPNPCKNSGECATKNGQVKCICLSGFLGDLCDGAVGACHSNPCIGGATCKVSSETEENYKCVCDTDSFVGYHPKVGCYKYGVKTENGNSRGSPCTFPFLYKGTIRNQCIPMDAKRPWCAVNPDYDVKQNWGYCSSDVKVNGGNDPLATCAFPFIYKNHSYDHCIDNGSGKKWCGTVTNYDINLYWGYC